MSNDNLDWIDGMIAEHGGSDGTFDAERYEELMRAAENGNSGDGGRDNGRAANNSRRPTPEEIANILDIPEDGGEYEDAPDPYKYGVARFLLGTLRGRLASDARARKRSHEYETKDAIEKFSKKFWVRPDRVNGNVVEADGVLFHHQGFGDFTVVGTCPKCGQPTESDRMKHYTEFGRMIANFVPHRGHRCGAVNEDEEEIEQALDGLRPVPPPAPKQEEPPRQRVKSSRRDPRIRGEGGAHWVSSDSIMWREQDEQLDLRVVAEPDEQPQETEVDQQRRAHEAQAQRQPGERAAGHRRPRQRQGFSWGMIAFLGFLLIVGIAIVAGSVALRGRAAEVAGAVQQPAVQLAAVQAAGAAEQAVTEQQVIQPTNTPLPPGFLQQQAAPAVPQADPLQWEETVAGAIWQAHYQDITIRIGRGGPNGTTYLIYWERLSAGRQATYGANAQSLEEAQALAYRLTVEGWAELPALLGWE